MPRKCKELRLSFHSSSSVFTGTFTYDLPSFGIVFRISCPGVTRSESLGARHSASFCAAATSSPGISPTVLRCHVTTIIRTTTTTAAAPASVRTRHGRARFPSLAAAAAASTRTRKFAEGSAPRATSGSSASNRAFRARTSSSSAEHLAQLRRCSSRSFAIAPVSAASRNGSFHFSHAFFISSRPTKVFAPRTPGTLPFLLECRAPRPHRQRPSLQPARAAERCAVFPAGVQFLSAGGPASPAARRPSLRQPSRVFPRCARRCLAPAAAGSLSGGSTPAGTRSGSPKRGIFPLPGATQTSGRRARMLPALHLPRRPNCPGCCTQSEKRAADSQRRNRQIPPRDYALRLWQSTHSRTRLSRLSCPSRIDTAPGPPVQKIARMAAMGGGQFERLARLSPRTVGIAAHIQPLAAPSQSEEKDGLECRQNRLQLGCNLHGLKFLQLLSVEDRHQVAKKTLLCLGHLLLQGVNLNHDCSDLRGVPTGIQQITKLLDQGLRCLEEGHKCCLARLKQLIQLAHLAGLQLEKVSHNLQGRRFLRARLNVWRLQLLQYFLDVQPRQVGCCRQRRGFRCNLLRAHSSTGHQNDRKHCKGNSQLFHGGSP